MPATCAPTVSADQADIVVRWFDADGHRVGAEMRVNAEVGLSQDKPQIAALANGGFVSVLEMPGVERSTGWGRGIVAQVYGADGLPVGGEVPVNTQTGNEQVDPAVAAAPDCGFAVVW